MYRRFFDKTVKSVQKNPPLYNLLKWTIIAVIVGLLAGSASAFFLVSLYWAGDLRDANLWMIALLPVGGMVIGLVYHYFGKDVVKGNDQLLDEFYHPRKVIPLKMAPMVLFGTVITHLFGGSAGREGTAVQMGGAIADQWTKIFKLKPIDRKTLILTGIAAGFASVFGTPLAGAIFAIEVVAKGKKRFIAILPVFVAAFVADYTCTAWGVGHTSYFITEVPLVSATSILWSALAGVLFGFAALLFTKSTHFSTVLFKRYIKWPPLRPVIGGAIFAAVVLSTGATKFIGLGIPTIVEAFDSHLNSYDFLLKIAFTAFTLGAGFKGGEVTPLFFVGATLGNALVWFIPLPLSLLAGMGFVAVFSGATNTPMACTLMGIELFGLDSALFIAVACGVAYLFSGHPGIYSSQANGSFKHFIYNKLTP